MPSNPMKTQAIETILDRYDHLRLGITQRTGQGRSNRCSGGYHEYPPAITSDVANNVNDIWVCHWFTATECNNRDLWNKCIN